MTTGEIITTIVVACLGSTGLTTLIQFLINRKDKRKEQRDEVIKQLKEIKKLCDIHEKDICRSQLLLLISNYPEDKTEIMRLAEHYFEDLHANWYMSSIFNTWLETNNLTKPDWFDAN